MNLDASAHLQEAAMGLLSLSPTNIVPLKRKKQSHHPTTNQEDAISCICGSSYDDGFSIACDECSRWYHAACFNIVPGQVPDTWKCSRCDGQRQSKKRRKEREDVLVVVDDAPLPHIPLTHHANIIPNPHTRSHLDLLAASQRWRGITAITPWVSPVQTTQHDPIQPPYFALHTTSSIPASSLITPFTSTITPSSTYLADPLNAYAHLGLPKPFVHLLGHPLDVALDARMAGDDARWVRSGCKPNAVLKPVLCDTNDKESLGFAVFALRDLNKGEEVVLGWEWDDSHAIHHLPALLKTPGLFPPAHKAHLRAQMANILHLITSTFPACACGAKATDCALSAMQRFVSSGDDFCPRPDLGPLVGATRGFRTRECVPGSGGLGGVEIDNGQVVTPSRQRDDEETEDELDVDGPSRRAEFHPHPRPRRPPDPPPAPLPPKNQMRKRWARSAEFVPTRKVVVRSEPLRVGVGRGKKATPPTVVVLRSPPPPASPPTAVVQPMSPQASPPTVYVQPTPQASPPTVYVQPTPQANPPTVVVQPTPLASPPTVVVQPIHQAPPPVGSPPRAPLHDMLPPPRPTYPLPTGSPATSFARLSLVSPVVPSLVPSALSREIDVNQEKEVLGTGGTAFLKAMGISNGEGHEDETERAEMDVDKEGEPREAMEFDEGAVRKVESEPELEQSPQPELEPDHEIEANYHEPEQITRHLPSSPLSSPPLPPVDVHSPALEPELEVPEPSPLTSPMSMRSQSLPMEGEKLDEEVSRVVEPVEEASRVVEPVEEASRVVEPVEEASSVVEPLVSPSLDKLFDELENEHEHEHEPTPPPQPKVKLSFKDYKLRKQREKEEREKAEKEKDRDDEMDVGEAEVTVETILPVADVVEVTPTTTTDVVEITPATITNVVEVTPTTTTDVEMRDEPAPPPSPSPPPTTLVAPAPLNGIPTRPLDNPWITALPPLPPPRKSFSPPVPVPSPALASLPPKPACPTPSPVFTEPYLPLQPLTLQAKTEVLDHIVPSPSTVPVKIPPKVNGHVRTPTPTTTAARPLVERIGRIASPPRAPSPHSSQEDGEISLGDETPSPQPPPRLPPRGPAVFHSPSPTSGSATPVPAFAARRNTLEAKGLPRGPRALYAQLGRQPSATTTPATSFPGIPPRPTTLLSPMIPLRPPPATLSPATIPAPPPSSTPTPTPTLPARAPPTGPRSLRIGQAGYTAVQRNRPGDPDTRRRLSGGNVGIGNRRSGSEVSDEWDREGDGRPRRTYGRQWGREGDRWRPDEQGR